MNEENAVQQVWLNGMRRRDERNEANPPVAVVAPKNSALRSKVLATQRSSKSALDLAARLPLPPTNPSLANEAPSHYPQVNPSELKMMRKYDDYFRGRPALFTNTIYTPAFYERDPNYQAFKAAELAKAAPIQRPPISSAPGVPRRQLTNAELASRAANPPVAVVAPRRPAALATYAELAGPAQRSASNAPVGTNEQRRRAILQLERLGRTYTNAELAQEIKKVQRFDATMKSRKKGGKSRKQRKTRRN